MCGSRKYVEKHKDELPKHSVALVHDTGTGKVTGFGLQGRENIMPILEPELKSLKSVDGWKGLDKGGIGAARTTCRSRRRACRGSRAGRTWTSTG